ncbi:MAG: hypothetical protein PVH73_01970 [Candidatus Bathyarchaeota archaeon]|jgi:hypothetical protein
MQELRIFNNERNLEARKMYETSLTKVITFIFLVMGAIALFVSIVYASSILAFIGLGLVFWGAFLAYIQPEQYTKKVILDATVIPSIDTLNQIIQELNYKGKAIYLPPEYLKNPEASKVYISKQKEGELPEPELTIKHENKLFVGNPNGILLTPPGAQLSRLFEKLLDTNFTKTDLNYITHNMPKILIENLEIAENVKIETENNKIKIKITNSTFKETHKGTDKLSHTYPYFSCPLSSAVACAFTKATGKPIAIENVQVSEDGNVVETTYHILGNIETETGSPETGKIEIETETYSPAIKSEGLLTESSQLLTRKHLLSNLASLFLTSFGLIILVWVGWLTWYDMTVWSKNIVTIFLGSRVGEAISLGIGMKLIYYLLIGLASFLSGLVTYIRSNMRKV